MPIGHKRQIGLLICLDCPTVHYYLIIGFKFGHRQSCLYVYFSNNFDSMIRYHFNVLGLTYLT